jgi:hypothetical protein
LQGREFLLFEQAFCSAGVSPVLRYSRCPLPTAVAGALAAEGNYRESAIVLIFLPTSRQGLSVAKGGASCVAGRLCLLVSLSASRVKILNGFPRTGSTTQAQWGFGRNPNSKFQIADCISSCVPWHPGGGEPVLLSHKHFYHG